VVLLVEVEGGHHPWVEEEGEPLLVEVEEEGDLRPAEVEAVGDLP